MNTTKGDGIHDYSSAVTVVNEALQRLGLAELAKAQKECLADGSRTDEALSMIEDLQARCDLPEIIVVALFEWLETTRND